MSRKGVGRDRGSAPPGKSGEIGGNVKGERKHLKNYPNSQEGWDSSQARAAFPRPTPNTY